MSRQYRVLAIQSHVVSGYVGNKSATFPLQILGFEVDAINTVQFSNHTGYGKFKGQVISEEDFDELVEGLKQNDLLQYTHVLTGYCRSPQLLSKIGKLVQELKKSNPNLIYVCDPVMGDNGLMYVPQEVLPVYKDEILPLADVICPNQFEAELLTNIPTSDQPGLMKTILALHDRGVKTVVISSSELGPENHLLGVASTIVGGVRTSVSIEIPKLNAIFTGTGDLFASLLLAWITLTEHDVKEALERTIATLQSILERTAQGFSSKDPSKLTSKERELKLIQSKTDIETPVVRIHAKPFTS